MAFEVHFCALASDAKLGGLHKLHETISWRLFQALDGTHYRLDFVRADAERNEQEAPDWRLAPENFAIPLEFEPRDAALNNAYRVLLKEKYGNASSRPTVKFALMLARAVQARVLVTASNDDGIDAAVSVADDELESWTFDGCDEEVSVARNGNIERLALDPDGEKLLHGLAARKVQEMIGRVPSFMSTFDPEPEIGLYHFIERRVGTDVSEIRARRRVKAEWNAKNPNPKKLESWSRRQEVYCQGERYDYSKVPLNESIKERLKRFFGL